MQMIQDSSKYFLNGPGDRPDAANVVLVITDGVPYPDDRRAPALQFAQEAQDRGIIMFSVGITDAIEEDVLKSLSSEPRKLHQNYFTSTDFDVLEEIADVVAQQTCTGGEEPTPPPGKAKKNCLVPVTRQTH